MFGLFEFVTPGGRTLGNKELKKGFAGDSVFQFQKHLLNHFLKGEKLMNSAEEYLENLKVEDYIYKSNLKKKLLEIV